MRVYKLLFVVVIISLLVIPLANFTAQAQDGAPWPPTLLGPENRATVTANPPRLCARYSDPQGQDGWGRFEVHGIGDEGAHISPWIPVKNNRRFCWRDNGGPWRVGVHGWSARAKDSGGLQSAAAAEWSLTIPQAPPSRTRSRNATCTVNSISVAPAAPQRVGTRITISASANCTGGVQTLRIRVNGTLLRTIRGSNGQVVWNTNGLNPDDYVITATATGKVDRARGSRSHTYLLTNASQPAQQNNPPPQPTNPPPPAPQQNNNSGNNSQNTESNNQSSTSVRTDCPSWEARLQVGGRGRSIVDGLGASPVRSHPENSNISFWIQEGDEFDVIGGPMCRPGYGEGKQTRYFEINFNGRTGWIAETNGTMYYLEPISQQVVMPTATTQPTPVPSHAPTSSSSENLVYFQIELPDNSTFGLFYNRDTNTIINGAEFVIDEIYRLQLMMNGKSWIEKLIFLGQYSLPKQGEGEIIRLQLVAHTSETACYELTEGIFMDTSGVANIVFGYFMTQLGLPLSVETLIALTDQGWRSGDWEDNPDDVEQRILGRSLYNLYKTGPTVDGIRALAPVLTEGCSTR